MALSPEGRTLAEAAYRRSQLWRKYRVGGVGAGLMALIPATNSFSKLIMDPHSSRYEAIIVASLMGLIYGVAIMSAYFVSSRRKRDEELVRFFEKQYPDDCSWLQEEKILAEAEDIRLKAKVDFLIHKASQ